MGYKQRGKTSLGGRYTGTHSKKFCVVNRYNLQEEFPVMTLRRIFYRSAIEEILWIYQKKSNRVADLSTHIWDSWADKTAL